MEIEYSLTFDDLLALWRHIRKEGDRFWAARVACYWACIILVTASVMTGFVLIHPSNKWRGPPGEEFFGLGFYLAGLVLVMRVAADHGRARMMRRLYERGPDRWVLASRRLIIGPEAYSVIGAPYHTQIAWAGIWKIAVTKEHAFFYLSPMHAYIVPRRAFSDPKSFEEFVALARRFHDAPMPAPVPRPTGITTGALGPVTEVFRPDAP
jgi:hypothetical protein